MKKLIMTVLVSCIVLAGYTQIEKDTGYIVKIGDRAPEVSLKLTTGETLHLSDLKGSVVVLQFTASWCSVCRKEMPHLETEVWLPNKDKDFLLIGVDYDEPLEKVVAFKEQMKITYPMALDPGADIFARYAEKQSGVTRNVVIDKDGTIAFLTRLYDVNEFNRMKEVIADLLGSAN